MSLTIKPRKGMQHGSETKINKGICKKLIEYGERLVRREESHIKLDFLGKWDEELGHS